MTNCPKERSNGQKNMQEYEQREKERYEDTILNIYQKDKQQRSRKYYVKKMTFKAKVLEIRKDVKIKNTYIVFYKILPVKVYFCKEKCLH